MTQIFLRAMALVFLVFFVSFASAQTEQAQGTLMAAAAPEKFSVGDECAYRRFEYIKEMPSYVRRIVKIEADTVWSEYHRAGTVTPDLYTHDRQGNLTGKVMVPGQPWSKYSYHGGQAAKVVRPFQVGATWQVHYEYPLSQGGVYQKYIREVRQQATVLRQEMVTIASGQVFRTHIVQLRGEFRDIDPNSRALERLGQQNEEIWYTADTGCAIRMKLEQHWLGERQTLSRSELVKYTSAGTDIAHAAARN